MDGMIREFLAESYENLDQLDRDMVALEENPSDREIFGRVFRTIHTIKGTCGFLAFSTLESVTHAGENVLAQLRDGALELDEEITGALLEMFDAVRAMLDHIERTGREGEADYGPLITDLERWSDEKKNRDPVPADDEREPLTGDPVDLGDEVREDPDRSQVAEASGTSGDASGADAVPTSAARSESSLRVDVRALDHLMNLIGELVLARNQIMQLMPAVPDGELEAAAHRLDGLTGELQEAVMRTRMQPIRTVWSRLPRFVRDLAVASGKKIELKMVGQETDLDKSVMEAIRGSLLHLVRNAVDHGLETPAERVECGKPEVGHILLAAAHEGGNVVIEVTDDGRGLDHEAILYRAVERGLLTPDEARDLAPREIDALIFRPGFSTAREVTELSGRGVGLDVVRANVEAMGGAFEVRSIPGRSTSFRLQIPLTLAIVPVLLVRSRGHRFAIPQVGVVELVRPRGADGSLGIEDLHGVPVFRLRDRLLPLVDLASEVGLDGRPPVDDGRLGIVVLQTAQRTFGLVVDAVEDSQEIVVKSVGRLLGGLPYVGAAILGDGGVALILDVVRLGFGAGVVSDVRQHASAESAGESDRVVSRGPALLCLRGPDDERMALRVDHVVRLESVLASRIERVAGRPVLQYRDDILPLVELEQVLPERRRERRTELEPDPTGSVQVVVCELGGRRVGVVVHRILDIIPDPGGGRRPASRDGVEACIVLRDRVTELLDLDAVVRLDDPGFSGHTTPPTGGTS
jgi:two-component system chemotaxis sensor kinase CheA